MDSAEKFGYIVMDGKNTLFGNLSGQTPVVLNVYSDDVVPSRARGQSAMAFARHCKEMVRNYLKRSAEIATGYYIDHSTSQPNVSWLILALSADFNAQNGNHVRSGFLDNRLEERVLDVVTVSTGVENGFRQALELSYEKVKEFSFPIKEKNLLQELFHELAWQTRKYVFGVDDVVNVLDCESCAVKTLIVWENIPIHRYVMKNSSTGETVIKYLNEKQQGNTKDFDKFNVEEKTPLPFWLVDESKRIGCELQQISDNTNEGFQFWERFGGVAALLDHPLGTGKSLQVTGEASSFPKVKEIS